MKHLFSFFITLLLATIPAGIFAQNSVLILNKAGDSAWQLNTETGEKLAEYKTGEGPHEVAVSPDQSTAVITDYGASASGNTLTVVDLQKQEVEKTISLGKYRQPHGVEWFSDGKRVIVTAEAQQSVVVVNIDSGEIISAIKTGQQVSHMVQLSADEQMAYVTNLGSGSLSILNLKTKKVQKTIDTGAGTEGITLVPSTNELWITNRSGDTISIVDISDYRIVETLESSAFPIRAETSPDGETVAVSNAKSSDISIFDTGTRNLLRTVSTVDDETSGMPIGLTFSDDGNRLFVANSNIDQIAVFDTESWERINTFETGDTPDGIAFIKSE